MALVRWLAARGHALSVVAAAPLEVAGDAPPVALEIEGIRVRRCPLVAAPDPRGLARRVRNLSFALASAPVLLNEAGRFRPDLVVALAPSAAAASAALAAARRAGAPAWLHLEEDAPSLGLEAAFAGVSLAAYDAEERLAALGVAPQAGLPLAPWVDTRAIMPRDDRGALRAQCGFAPDQIVALYAGQCADPRVADALVGAARGVPPHGAIRIAVRAKGPALDLLAAAAASLPPLVLLPWPRAPEPGALLGVADIQLMPEGIDAVDALLPAKLGALLASGRPIIAAATAKLPAALAAAVVPVAAPGEELAAAIVQLAAAPGEAESRDRAARLAAQDYFEKERVLRRLERRLAAASASASPAASRRAGSRGGGR